MISQKEQQTSIQHQPLHFRPSPSQQTSPLPASHSPQQLQSRQSSQPLQQMQSEQQQQQLPQKSLHPAQQLPQVQVQQTLVQTQSMQPLQQPQLPLSQPHSTHTQLPGGLQMSSGPVVNQPLLNPRLNATADSVASAGGSQHPPSGQTSVSQQPPVPNPPTSQPVTAGQLNTATLCKLGQETVQDIVAKAQDIFQTLKNLQPPNGTSASANLSNDKRLKNQELLRAIKMLFKKLRIIFEKCNDSNQLQGMEYMHIESLIPLKDEWDMKSEERKTSETYRLAQEESRKLSEQVQMKNAQLKEIIDNLRNIIWEVNNMLTMRKP